MPAGLLKFYFFIANSKYSLIISFIYKYLHLKPTRGEIARSSVEIAITESEHLIKTPGKIEKENLIKKGREELRLKLVEVQERIKTFIKNLGSDDIEE